MNTSNKFLALCVWATCFGIALVAGVYKSYTNPAVEQPSSYPAEDCSECVSQATLDDTLEQYILSTDLITTLAGKIDDFLANDDIKRALSNFIAANVPPVVCPTTCTTATAPPVAWFLGQITSVLGSPLVNYQISSWTLSFSNAGFTGFGTLPDGTYTNTGTVSRDVVFDFSVRCGCTPPVSTTIRYYQHTRRKRDASSSPYDAGFEIFRAKRYPATADTYSCGNDNCAGKSATVKIYRKTTGGSNFDVKTIQVSNLCYVLQSFRVGVNMGAGDKVYMKLTKPTSLLDPARCTWTISAAYVAALPT